MAVLYLLIISKEERKSAEYQPKKKHEQNNLNITSYGVHLGYAKM